MAQADLISEPIIKDFWDVRSSMVPSSKRSYSHVLFKFQEFCNARDIKPREATSKDIASFLDQYTHRKLKTRLSYRKIINVLYNWMVEEDIIRKNPVKSVPMPKGQSQRSDKKVISSKAFRKMLSKCQSLKMKTLLMFIYYTGVRAEETVMLRIDNVNLSENYVFIPFSKTALGNRRIQIHRDLRVILMAYIEKWYDMDLSERWLFPNKRGKQLKYRSLLNWIQNVQYGDKVKYACHDFRRAFATRVYESTKDIYLLQRLLGHSNISTTERYIKEIEGLQDQLQEVVF